MIGSALCLSKKTSLCRRVFLIVPVECADRSVLDTHAQAPNLLPRALDNVVVVDSFQPVSHHRLVSSVS